MTQSAVPHTAMVLAAGRGKRMRPISATTPKPLIEIHGRPLIDHVLDRLVAAGVQRAIINVHYQADLIEKHVQRRRDIEVVISDEREALLETGGAVAKVLDLLGDEPFLHMNTDSIWIEGPSQTLPDLCAHYQTHAMDGLLLLASTVTSVGYEGRGDFLMDDEGLLTRRPEQRIAPFVFAGAAVLHPRLFAGRKVEPFSLNVLFDKAIADHTLHGYLMDGIWLHVGTPQAIGQAERRIANSRG